MLVLSGSMAFAEGPVGWASLNGGTRGGMGGDSVFVSSMEELKAALHTPGPLVIVVEDTIDLSSSPALPVNHDFISLIGHKDRGSIVGGGFEINGSNIIIRNLSIGDSYEDGHWDGKGDPGKDCLTLYGKNIWIDHCSLYHGFDGLLDISGRNGEGADYITISWSHFRDHNKVMLVGSNDRQTYARGQLRVTIHHCWFDGKSEFFDRVDGQNYRLTQRMPRVRFGDVHVFNNYYERIGSYCIAARLESDVVAEYNYFKDLKNPHIIEDKGKGLEDPDLLIRENYYDNVKGRRESNGKAFTPSDFYSYRPDVPELVMQGAGVVKEIP